MSKPIHLLISDGHQLKTLVTEIRMLKKVNNREMAFTLCNQEIPLENIIEIGGIPFI
ncbi:MAG: hypothetical protein ACKO8Q_01990 [Bacteroidota bacterium]|jgi:hypothetical protein